MPTLRPLASLVALVLLPLLAACGGGGGSGGGVLPPPSDPGTMSSAELAYAQEVLRLVNVERANNGLSALQWHEQASQVAYAHDVDMDVRNFFSHINPSGQDPLDRVVAAGITGFSSVGENIARGQSSPAEVMSAWMNSTGHRANILNSGYTHLGVGVHAAGDIWWTQVFLGLR
ncbi:MAG: CAP domain-containing protein [Planctomycetia bacterium]